VVPVSTLQDPFLLLAHHKHWFDPRDPLRGPFKAVGKALGLPYVDVEGFALHPHRGMDILTYVLDGSDGFRHRDSLNKTSRVYRGACAQWMRTGSGVMHEEFWETRPDRRTNIELFQLWINLPACQKMEVPVIRYIGATTEDRWLEHCPGKGVRVRDLGATLEASLERLDSGDGNRPSVRRRPPVTMQHVTMGPGTEWMAPVPSDHSAMVYVREGTATLSPAEKVKALQTATFQPDGNSVRVRNTDRAPLDLLLLTGKPLREPVAWRGPIVMNKEQELNDAFRQLQSGTFLDRNVVLREHKATLRHPG
jgi:redox-sensitive bicupin YhaK (pirin superfamily)